MKKMNRTYLVLAAAALVAASCSKDVLIDRNAPAQTKQMIGFSTFADKATRAGQSTDLEDYHTTFSVYATKKSTVDSTDPIQYVFGGDASTVGGSKTGTTVTFNSGAVAPNDWTYSPYRYWDKQATYCFIAFAPASAPLALNYYDKALEVKNAANNIVTTAAYALVGQNLQGDAATTAQIYSGFDNASGNDCDMMVAPVVNENGASHSTDVTFIFSHILAKLNVTVAKSEKLDDAVVTIKTISIDNLLNKGTYSNNTYKAATATTAGVSGWNTADYSSSKYTLNYAGDETDLNDSDDDKYYFIESLIMPQDIADGQSTLTIKYSITTGTGTDAYTENFTRKLDLADAFTNFFDRYNYTLNITIDPDIITFDANVVEWADYTESEQTIN